jgi:predicted ABC-type transport system involved in lysophospholipase L1 biosynthesis ATPase subunit
MALLSFDRVSKRQRYGGREVIVLNGVSFEVDEGDYIGLWGAPQSGKSSLLRLAAGIELPDAGTVQFAGRDLAHVSASERAQLLRRKIGLVFSSPQESTIWEAHRGDEIVDYVAVPLIGDGRSRGFADAAAIGALERVGMVSCTNLSIHQLSLAERVRVALARALVREPSLLLVDEPAIIPSPSERDAVRDLLRALARDERLTVMVASQDPGLLRGAKRIFSVGDGRLLSGDRIAQVLPFTPPDRKGPLTTP